MFHPDEITPDTPGANVAGGSDWIRTSDLTIMSRLLCR